MAISHATCTHPRTPAGRRACRSGSLPIRGQDVIADVQAITPAPIRRARVEALQNRLMATADAPVKLNPRRMARQATLCVQAELHTGKGRCACGWSA